jgi:uncharacterized protein YndB with AHSA1/START domain
VTSLDLLQVSRHIPASPARLFRAWTTPDEVKRWFARPEGWDVPNVDMDVRVGGRYRIEVHGNDVSVTAIGRYHTVVPDEKLTFSFAWEEPLLMPVLETGETTVTVEFRASGGGTDVVLTHERLRGDAMFAFHRMGWTDCFDRLEVLIDEEGEDT